MNSILKIENLNKKYKKFCLKDINIEIPKGSIVGFIGENGAGKTTTIKSILNLINIDSGDIKIFGKDYKDCEESLKEDIGVVLDNSFLPEQLNPKDINKIMKDIYNNWDENKYFDYLSRFNLPQEKNIKDYSSGMLAKLKMITALSHNPKLLILDEPTSGLDPIARNDILEIFQEFIEEKDHSIFVSSHITSDLEQISDYIIFISNGQIILSIDTNELNNNYAIVKCNKKEFESIDNKDMISYKKTKYNYQVLIDNKTKFKRKYKIKTIDKATIEDIMLFYIKGEKNE